MEIWGSGLTRLFAKQKHFCAVSSNLTISATAHTYAQSLLKEVVRI